MALRFFSVVMSIFLLSACAHPPEYAPLTTAWSERQEQLSALTDWQFRGHAVFKMPERKFSANVYWQQNADQYQIMLFGPFGLGGININGQPNSVYLKDSHGHTYKADTPESLMQNQLGWSLPVSSLYYWVRGLPAPGPVTHVTYDAYHRMVHLEQQGWGIDYRAYQRVQAIELPREIIFAKDNYYMHLTIEDDGWRVF